MTTEQQYPDIWAVARIPFDETKRRDRQRAIDETKWTHHASREEADLAVSEYVPGTRCAMVRLSPDTVMTFVGFEGESRVWLDVNPPIEVGRAKEPGGKVAVDPKAMKYMGEVVKYGTAGAHAMRRSLEGQSAN